MCLSCAILQESINFSRELTQADVPVGEDKEVSFSSPLIGSEAARILWKQMTETPARLIGAKKNWLAPAPKNPFWFQTVELEG